ncbi:MAG TPA: spirocyclase AveC family protein [Pseudonocardia sp.]|nr:spirocyclase AveC family protein [Pseudonocardia sp.]
MTAVEAATPGTSTTGPRKARPVLWWATAGVAFLLLQAYVYGAWIAGDDFRPSPLGSDPVPRWEQVCAWILQPLFTLGALAAAVWVIRGCLRERRLTMDGKLLLGWYSIIWLDPAGNYLRPQFMFNAIYVNRGSWVEHIPGWVSPNGHLLPDTFFMEMPAYGMAVMATVGTSTLMGRVARKRPRTGRFGLFGVGWLTSGIGIILFEAPLCMRSGFASWSATSLPDWLVIWPGTRYQVPLIPDPIFWGAVFASMAALRHFRDDAGLSFVERGVNRLRLSPRARNAVGALAVIGFANVAMSLHTIPSVWASLYLRDTVPAPSYLRAGVCGEGTEYPCPGPGVPIVPSGIR